VRVTVDWSEVKSKLESASTKLNDAQADLRAAAAAAASDEEACRELSILKEEVLDVRQRVDDKADEADDMNTGNA
jgi:hypothetical protein